MNSLHPILAAIEEAHQLTPFTYRKGTFLPFDMVEKSFWERTRIASGGCIEWTSVIMNKGYGIAKIAGRPVRAHRFAYETHYGKIPKGLELDHLCRNRRCVNPLHLEAVTRRENLIRGNSPVGINHRRDICVNGHPLSVPNSKGWRVCKTCAMLRTRKYRGNDRQEIN